MRPTNLARALALTVLVSSFLFPTLGFADAGPPPSPTPAAPRAASAPIINLVFQWNFDVITEAVQKALQDIFGGLANGIQEHLFAPLARSSLNFLTQTPPSGTYANATVVALWGYSRDAALAGFGVVLVVCGYQVMLGRATASPYADALATLRDAFLGLLLAATSLAWTSVAIDLGNALVAGIGTVAIPTLGQTGFAGLDLETIVLGLVYLVLGILLVLQMLVRLALLDVLLIVAPLALLVGVLPQARHRTRLWADLFVGTLLTQFVQILALRLGTGLLTQLVPSLSDALLTFLAGIAVLWLVLKVPGLLNAGLHRAGGSATLLGTPLTYRGVTRMLGSAGATGGVGGAATPGSGSSLMTLGTSLGASPSAADGANPTPRATAPSGYVPNGRA